MADTTFTSGTVIASSWLNDVNDATYNGTGVFTPAGTGAVARTNQGKLREWVSIDDFGAIPNSESDAATNATALTNAYVAAEAAGINTVIFGDGGTYWFPAETTISRNNFTLDCRWATLKQVGHATDKSWLLITGHSNFNFVNFRLDGNRANTASVGPDRATLLVFNCSHVKIDGFRLTAAKGKGLAVSCGSTGSGATHITVSNGYADDCGTQAFIADGTTGGAIGSPPCEYVRFVNLTVGDTDHAGIAVNDGARYVTVENCFLDVNNATWDALGVRGARDVKIIGCTGRRGRNGIQCHTLDAAAIARGEICNDVTLIGNTWELNQQSGCLIAGVIGATIVGDVAKNNSQSGAGFFGFNITQVVGVRRSSRVVLTGPRSFDDQSSATQTTAIGVSASDDVKVSDPVMFGNVTDNRVVIVSGVTLTRVVGDGPDGATTKRGSVATGTITASSQATVTFTFTTAFYATPTWANASVLVGSGTRYLKVQHIQALTTGAITVLVSNDTALDISGTLYIEAVVL